MPDVREKIKTCAPVDWNNDYRLKGIVNTLDHSCAKKDCESCRNQLRCIQTWNWLAGQTSKSPLSFFGAMRALERLPLSMEDREQAQEWQRSLKTI